MKKRNYYYVYNELPDHNLRYYILKKGRVWRIFSIYRVDFERLGGFAIRIRVGLSKVIIWLKI